MSSGIDSSKPADGTPAVKTDLRTNLETARSELNHGGFATSLSPANYGPPASTKIEDHLAAIDNALGSAGGGAASFTGLSDTPGAYTGAASKFVKVKADETALEFVASGGATNADAVSYDPPWTGAATRSVESRLSDIASVRDFGAVGDGVTDDAAACQAAIDSGATVVLFPRTGAITTYAIGTRLTVNNRTLIGKNTELKAISGIASSGNESCLIKVTGNRTTIEGFTLDGNGLTESCIKVIGNVPNRNAFKDLYLIGATANGFEAISSCWMSWMERVRCDSVPTGFRIEGGGDNTTWTLIACYAAGNASRGFVIQSVGAVLSGCAVDNCGDYPVEIAGPSMVKLTGCDFEGNNRWLKMDGPNCFCTVDTCILNGYDDSGGPVINMVNGKLWIAHSRWFNGSAPTAFASVASGKKIIATENNKRLTAENITGGGIVRELRENSFFAYN